MKQLTQFGILSNLLLSTAALALNPVQGFYVGVMADISHGPNKQEITFVQDGQLFTGKESYSILGGGGGGTFGYKLNHFRLEGEVLYTRISTGPLQVGSCTLQSPNVLTPTGVCPQDHFLANSVGFNGSSAALYGLVNLYYDFYRSESDNPLSPYIGIGVGEVKIKDGINFIYTNTAYSHGRTESVSTQAGQAIVGLSYYMDDFAWVGMDYRFLTTRALPYTNSTRYTLNTINFNVNFAFDKGGIDLG